MAVIKLCTFIDAPAERVFNLSRSIELHTISTAHTGETAVAGTTSGLINLGETVTWRAKHLGKWRTMTVKITAMVPFHFFEDEMQEGDFKFMRHKHFFETKNNGTVMLDEFAFASPYGVIGQLTDIFFMKKYLTKFLLERNATIKHFAENNIQPV